AEEVFFFRDLAAEPVVGGFELCGPRVELAVEIVDRLVKGFFAGLRDRLFRPNPLDQRIDRHGELLVEGITRRREKRVEFAGDDSLGGTIYFAQRLKGRPQEQDRKNRRQRERPGADVRELLSDDGKRDLAGMRRD